MSRIAGLARGALCAAALFVGAGQASAGDFSDLTPVADAELGELRGGFVGDFGLLRFGIDLTGVVAQADGTVVSNYTARFDGATLTLEDPTGSVRMTGNGVVVGLQSGSGNQLPEAFAGGGLVNIVQNTRDNVIITQSSVVTIDVPVGAAVAAPQMRAIAEAISSVGLIGR